MDTIIEFSKFESKVPHNQHQKSIFPSSTYMTMKYNSLWGLLSYNVNRPNLMLIKSTVLLVILRTLTWNTNSGDLTIQVQWMSMPANILFLQMFAIEGLHKKHQIENPFYCPEFLFFHFYFPFCGWTAMIHVRRNIPLPWN